MPGETNIYVCGCNPMPGTQPPDIAPYVVSVNSLQGILTIAADGGVSVRSEGNTIFIGADGESGLGTVTSVDASSSNSNLVVTGGPITTTGTFSFSLAGALNSISGLVTAADKMIYTTASNTYAVTDLTSFARTLLDDANNTAARSTLGLVIGTNVQAWNADLDSFVTNASWSGSALTLAGAVTVGGTLTASTDVTIIGNTTVGGTLDVTGLITGTAGFSGPGSGLTALNGDNITSGSVDPTVGGTGLTNYTVGDLLYASSSNVLARLNSVAGSKYLRSTNAGFAPAWSTLNLSNSATTGDLFYGSSANTMGNLADVATGNVLLSGGVGVAPAYGKVTSTHTDGTTIATVAAGVNGNITEFSNIVTFSDTAVFNSVAAFNNALQDSSASAGNAGDVLTSTGGNIDWSNQISLDTLTINTSLYTEGTIISAGTTGSQTINKMSGVVNFAAGATSLVVTNSLCVAASTRVHVTVVSNDFTMKSAHTVTTTGSFTIYPDVAPTAETSVLFSLVQIS